MYMSKTSINSKIQKFGRGALRIFTLYSQIQGEVVVGTINGDNLVGSSYLYPLITTKLTPT